MNPRKTNARRGYRQRESRRQAAANWQPEVFTPKEGKMNAELRRFLVAALVCMTVLCVAGVVVGYFATRPTVVSTPPPAVVEKNSVSLLPTPVVEPTQIPVIEPTAIPVVILPINPSIEGKLGTITQQGEYLDTILGKRITFTCRKIVVPDKAWNEELSLKELKSIETTWVDFTISVPEGMFARIFAGGIRQGTNIYNEGVLMNLKPGTYEFSLRNGEIVLWYPKQDKFEQDDLVRIFDQIRNGNFDIHSELAFFATTTDLLSTIPADLVQKNKIEIVPALEPITK